jgi:hypothetical protein
MKYMILAMMSFALASCATSVAPPVKPAPPLERPAAALARPAIDVRGLEAVMGKDLGTLKRLFGEPRLDILEVQGRKVQFTGRACILDAYLYPDGQNRTEIVTHVDARRSDGAAVDRAACIDALKRR